MWGQSQNAFVHEPPNEEDMGILQMRIGLSGGKSIAKSQYHARAFKIIRPHYLDDSGQVYYTIANPGGGYVGGDSYRIDLELEPDTSVLLTDQSAAKVYKTPGNYVVQNVEFTLAKNSVLEYIPNQLILYRDADYRQEITVNMDPEASLFLSDIVTPGWSPDGGHFLYKQAHLRTEVRMNGEIALIDNVRIEPTGELFSELRDSFVGTHTHFATVICIDPRITNQLIDKVREAINSNLEGRGQIRAAVTQADVPGFVVRSVADWTEDLMKINLAVANVIRGELRGQPPVHLRQY